MYSSGQANSFADLLQAVQTICTENGYTLNGNVLSKGTLFVEVAISPDGNYLQVQGGTGVDGTSALTGRATRPAAAVGINVMTESPNPAGGAPLQIMHPMTFPVSYECFLHADPDEFYMTIKYQVNCFQWLSFGQSNLQGLPGTGNWYAATANLNDNGTLWDLRSAGGGYNNSFNPIFMDSLQGYDIAKGGVHHNLEGNAWNTCLVSYERASYLIYQPNSWNGESILIPVCVYTVRPSGFISPVLQASHMRWIQIQNLDDQQIVTLGPDRWKVYPSWRRSSTADSGGGSRDGFSPGPLDGGTGLMGFALRYDGP